MAWFKQPEQKSPAPPQGTAPATAAPAPPVPAVPASAVAAERAVAPSVAPQPSRLEPPGAMTAASRVSRGLKLHGEVTGREDLAIDGELEGSLLLEGARVTIGPGGRVQAELTAREIVVHGEMHGDLHAEERIAIGPSATVRGTATAKRVAIAEGAMFSGFVEVLRPGESSSVARSASRTDARASARGASASAAPSKSSPAEKVWSDSAVVASDPTE